MGPTFNLKKKQKNKTKGFEISSRDSRRFVIIFFKFSPLTSLFDSRVSNCQNSSGQTRKVLYATRATREYQKHEISSRIQVNIRKIIVFSFSQIYDVLLVP